jgi:aspartate aminotransferase-like enzyme
VLFLVDFVASAFAEPLEVAKWNIDLGLLGSQKVLSLPPDLGISNLAVKLHCTNPV